MFVVFLSGKLLELSQAFFDCIVNNLTAYAMQKNDTPFAHVRAK